MRVLDVDQEAARGDKTVTVTAKISAPHQPVPPEAVVLATSFGRRSSTG